MSDDKSFWDRLAKIYNNMFENKKTYRLLYSMINDSLKQDMHVLEIGTGSGMIARAISSTVKDVVAVDYSEKMIEECKNIEHSENVTFKVQDSNSLEFTDNSFDAVIIANVLHIIDKPENTLNEIKRVLKDDGILIAPTYMWKECSLKGRIQKRIMIRRGFPIYHYWNSEEYIQFLSDNGFSCTKKETIKSGFNMCFVVCGRIP